MSVKGGCFLLLGQDMWSKKQYIEKVKSEILTPGSEVMNYYEAKEKDVVVRQLEDFSETLPFFVEKKLMILKDTGFFKAGRKEESEKFEEFLVHLPEYIVLLIDEKEVDKRGKLYKKLNQMHQILSFDYPGEEVVVNLLIKDAQKENIMVEQSIIYYLIRRMPEDISYILQEWEKLKSYTQGKTITKQVVDEICIFSLETRVFELVKCMAAGKSEEALDIYNRMLQSKESPIGILVLIARQFRMIYQVKYLKAKGQDQKQIANQMKIPYFAIKEMMEYSTTYRFEELEEMIGTCLETDRQLKTGKVEAGRGVELVILKALNH